MPPAINSSITEFQRARSEPLVQQSPRELHPFQLSLTGPCRGRLYAECMAHSEARCAVASRCPCRCGRPVPRARASWRQIRAAVVVRIHCPGAYRISPNASTLVADVKSVFHAARIRSERVDVHPQSLRRIRQRAKFRCRCANEVSHVLSRHSGHAVGRRG